MPDPCRGNQPIIQVELHLTEPGVGGKDFFRQALVVLSRLLTQLIARGHDDVLIQPEVVLTFDPICHHAGFIRTAKGNPLSSC